MTLGKGHLTIVDTSSCLTVTLYCIIYSLNYELCLTKDSFSGPSVVHYGGSTVYVEIKHTYDIIHEQAAPFPGDYNVRRQAVVFSSKGQH